MAPKTTKSQQQHKKKSSQNGTIPKNEPTGATGSDSSLQALPVELQQSILNIFSSAFPLFHDLDDLKSVIQEVKGQLFNREFAAAFAKQSYLQAYALRWSAARALGYTQILTNLHKKHALLRNTSDPSGKPPADSSVDDEQTDTVEGQLEVFKSDIAQEAKIICIGGGAGAEIVAFAAAYGRQSMAPSLEIVVVDSADWSEPVQKLTLAMKTLPTFSAHASQAAKAHTKNQPLLEDTTPVAVSFIHQDVLCWPVKALRESVQHAALCTIMFTLNELFSSSLPKSTSFLLNLTSAIPQGSHLLVIDSPGSYSEIQLGKSKGDATDHDVEGAPKAKKYPMKWLLDHTLLDAARRDDTAVWEKLESEDSLWFRVDQKDRERLKYGLELENMRYQLHLYRRV